MISRALGTGEKEKAKRVSALVCYASILFGIIMSAVVLLGMDFILKILGTDESTYGYTKGYLTWIGIGAADGRADSGTYVYRYEHDSGNGKGSGILCA